MRLSTRARYAVRAMIDLTVNGESGTVTRDQIAHRQQISPLYLSHILLRLKKAGLVVSAKGPGGGYSLAKSPAEIRVSDIAGAVGESLVPVACTAETEGSACQRVDQCAAHVLWEHLATAISDVLDSVTLADLCVEAGRRLQTQAETESSAMGRG